VRKDLRFDAALGAHQHNVVSLIGSDPCEDERGHEVAARAAARDQDLITARAAWGVRRCPERSRASSISHFYAARLHAAR